MHHPHANGGDANRASVSGNGFAPSGNAGGCDGRKPATLDGRADGDHLHVYADARGLAVHVCGGADAARETSGRWQG